MTGNNTDCMLASLMSCQRLAFTDCIQGLKVATFDAAGMSALGYLLTVAVAQKASGNSLDTISGIDTKIAAIPAPKSLLKWLHQQAASTVTRKCQRAAEQGPLVLTSYLMDRSV